MRIAIFSHGHPSFSKGGGELAAWHLFEGINAGGAHQAWFIARAPREMLHPGTPVDPHAAVTVDRNVGDGRVMEQLLRGFESS